MLIWQHWGKVIQSFQVCPNCGYLLLLGPQSKTEFSLLPIDKSRYSEHLEPPKLYSQISNSVRNEHMIFFR